MTFCSCNECCDESWQITIKSNKSKETFIKLLFLWVILKKGLKGVHVRVYYKCIFHRWDNKKQYCVISELPAIFINFSLDSLALCLSARVCVCGVCALINHSSILISGGQPSYILCYCHVNIKRDKTPSVGPFEMAVWNIVMLRLEYITPFLRYVSKVIFLSCKDNIGNTSGAVDLH